MGLLTNILFIIGAFILGISGGLFYGWVLWGTDMKRKTEDYANGVFKYRPMTLEERNRFARQSDNMKVKPNEKPEPFFYCNVGGIAPICSDCKRNHLNTIFRTEDIENWYSPQHTSNFKICEGFKK